MTVAEHIMSTEDLPGDVARAHCSCGLASTVREITTPNDYAWLDAAWEDHCDAVFEEATGG